MRPAFLTLAGLLSLTAAGGGEATGPGDPGSGSTSVTITPARAVVLTRDTVQLAELVEQGKLDLDARAFSFLTDLRPPPGVTVDPRLATITVRQLLHHAGGWNRDATFDPIDISKTIAQAVGAAEPVGSRHTPRRWRRARARSRPQTPDGAEPLPCSQESRDASGGMGETFLTIAT